MTCDFSSIMNGGEYNATWAPHIDLIGGLIILLFATFLFMTSPAPQEPSDIVDLEEE